MNTETNTKTTTENAVDKKAAMAEKRAAAHAALAAHAWIGSANATFVANVAKGKHHRGRFTVSPTDSGHKITPSPEGLAFFAARKASAKLTAEQYSAIAAARANKPGRYANRDFVANAGKIRGRYISLPVFAGSGDPLQQFLFAALIINEI